MTVKKPVPCSIYDIRGVEEWLDEMARQGLFLKEVNSRFDRAVFEEGDPAPVRYRLDPAGRDAEKDKEREEPYAQMGWNLVCHIPKWYYIFSCGDPEAPELYNDPQSLALAMEPLIRRSFRNSFFVALLCAGVCFLCLLPTPGGTLRNLLLWERPQDVFLTVLCPILLVLCLPLLVLDLRRIVKIRDTLAQGLALKAKKRWNRPSFWAWYVPFWCVIYFLPRLFFPYTGWEICGLEERTPAHPWPTAAQVEAAGASPLAEEPVTDGYIRYNDSPFAPVQEEVNRHRMLDPDNLTDHDLDTVIRYVRANSPRIARWIFRLELEQKAKGLESRQKAPFAPRDWPGLDRLEVSRYKDDGEDSWTFAALRGNDVLLVSYTGSAQWEDCLPLFLEALD